MNTQNNKRKSKLFIPLAIITVLVIVMAIVLMGNKENK